MVLLVNACFCRTNGTTLKSSNRQYLPSVRFGIKNTISNKPIRGPNLCPNQVPYHSILLL